MTTPADVPRRQVGEKGKGLTVPDGPLIQALLATEARCVPGLEGYVRQRTNVAETVEKLDGEDRQAILVKLFSDRKVLIATQRVNDIEGAVEVGLAPDNLKELLAQAIHTASPRRQGPFVAVNCGAGGDELLGAELFGYTAGAFTGAVKGGRKGKVELAQGGTLFLDEVEAMSVKMQVSLLRVMEESRVTPVGAEAPVAVDIRVIAAVNEDVQEAVRQKRFRLDLYHRLAAFPIVLPPLRERTEDLPLLIRHLLDDLGFSQLQPTAEVLALLCHYAWPGNVRELKNVLVRAAHLAPGTAITPAELPQDIVRAAAQPAPPPRGSLRDTEREMIVRALADTQGNLTTAAARLGIHRATLYRKVKKFGLLRVG